MWVQALAFVRACVVRACGQGDASRVYEKLEEGERLRLCA